MRPFPSRRDHPIAQAQEPRPIDPLARRTVDFGRRPPADVWLRADAAAESAGGRETRRRDGFHGRRPGRGRGAAVRRRCRGAQMSDAVSTEAETPEAAEPAVAAAAPAEAEAPPAAAPQSLRAAAHLRRRPVRPGPRSGGRSGLPQLLRRDRRRPADQLLHVQPRDDRVSGGVQDHRRPAPAHPGRAPLDPRGEARDPQSQPRRLCGARRLDRLDARRLLGRVPSARRRRGFRPARRTARNARRRPGRR